MEQRKTAPVTEPYFGCRILPHLELRPSRFTQRRFGLMIDAVSSLHRT
jgi:hypothetical protein